MYTKGSIFHEMICKEKTHLELLIRYLCRNGMDPFKAGKAVNEKIGSTVCEVHRGVLLSYEDDGEERSIVVQGIESTPTYLTVIKVKYVDGYEGYTYRCRFVVRK
jgi:hypothetical protein